MFICHFEWRFFFQFLIKFFLDYPDFFSFFQFFFWVIPGLLYSSNCSSNFLFQLKMFKWQNWMSKVRTFDFFQILQILPKKMLLGSKPGLFVPWNCSINFLLFKDAPLTEAGTITFPKSGEKLNQIRFPQFSLLRGRACSTVKLFFLVKNPLISSLKWTLYKHLEVYIASNLNPNFCWRYIRDFSVSFSTSKIKMPKTDNKKIYCFDLKGFENGTLYFHVTQPWLNFTLLYLSLITWFLNLTKKIKNRHFQLISLLTWTFLKKGIYWKN